MSAVNAKYQNRAGFCKRVLTNYSTWATLATVITVVMVPILLTHHSVMAHQVPSLAGRVAIFATPFELAVAFGFCKKGRFKRWFFDIGLAVTRRFNADKDEIIDRLHLGRIPLAGDNLEGFIAIVSFLEDEEMEPGWSGGFHVSDAGMKHQRVKTPDAGVMDVDTLQGGVDAIHTAMEGTVGEVLVHCKSGISRSAMATVAYLIQHKGMSPRAAYATVKGSRPGVFLTKKHFRVIDEFAKKHGRTKDLLAERNEYELACWQEGQPIGRLG